MPSRPTVLVTTSTLPRWHGDPEARFVLDLARHLQSRYDIRIIAPAYPSAALDEELEGVRVIRYRYGPMRRCETLTNPGAIMGRLRANPALRLVRIVMLSARGRDVEVGKGLALGADAYVTKPFSTRELVAKVRELLPQPA